MKEIKIAEIKLKIVIKIKVFKKKIEQRYDKNQGYQEKLNLDIKKSRSPRKKKIEDSYKN